MDYALPAPARTGGAYRGFALPIRGIDVDLTVGDTRCMFVWGSLLAVIAGGIVGWMMGQARARDRTNRQWMSALEEAKQSGLIDEQQSSDIIRMQGARRG